MIGKSSPFLVEKTSGDKRNILANIAIPKYLYNSYALIEKYDKILKIEREINRFRFNNVSILPPEVKSKMINPISTATNLFILFFSLVIYTLL